MYDDGRMRTEDSDWMDRYATAAGALFGDRVRFIGLQGSRAHGEGDGDSDVDAVLILDTVSADDLLAYSGMLDGLPLRDRSCGFIAGMDDLGHWDGGDAVHLILGTVPYKGDLTPLLDAIGEDEIAGYIHRAGCDVYHTCAHNIVHDRDWDVLKECYKLATFALRSMVYLRTGVYAAGRDELAGMLGQDEVWIAETSASLRRSEPGDFDEIVRLSRPLLEWSSGIVRGWDAKAAPSPSPSSRARCGSIRRGSCRGTSDGSPRRATRRSAARTPRGTRGTWRIRGRRPP